MPRKGAVFVFEGPDGVGKTTLAEAVRKMLTKTESSVLVVPFPGRDLTTLGGHVYELHHRPATHPIRNITPDALQTLHIAAHIDTIQSVIRPRIETGWIVLLDRYWWSTWVYGRLSGVDPVALEKMIAVERLYWHDLSPTAIFSVTRPAGAFEMDVRRDFLEKSREYESMADREVAHSRVIAIDNSRDAITVASEIFGIIKGLLHRKAGSVKELTTPILNRKNQKHPTPEFASLPFDRPLMDCEASHTLSNGGALTIWSKLTPANPTVVFDTYWRFAAERQEIFFNRFLGDRGPGLKTRFLIGTSSQTRIAPRTA